MQLNVSNIALIGSELAIAWSDGEESYLPLEKLRRLCPCASCTGEPDATGRVIRPVVTYDPNRSFALRGWRQVGGYALQPTWEDGHETGLYTFDYLRRIPALGEKLT